MSQKKAQKRKKSQQLQGDNSELPLSTQLPQEAPLEIAIHTPSPRSALSEHSSATLPVTVVHLRDVARQRAVGYNERWWPSILAHAQSVHGSTQGTVDECLAILASWGATLS